MTCLLRRIVTLAPAAALSLALALGAAQAQQPSQQPSQQSAQQPVQQPGQQPGQQPAAPVPGVPDLGRVIPGVQDVLKKIAPSGQGASQDAVQAKAARPAPTGRAAPRGADGLLQVPPAAQVTDLAGVLSAADMQMLRGRLEAIEKAHGAQMVILVVPSTQPEPIEDFANRVGTAWKVGRRGVGDGVLLIAAIDDRRARIDVARALEGAIPDATARRIIREAMAPRFAQQDYAGGLAAAVEHLARQIEGEGLPTPAGLPQRTVDAGEDTVALLLPFVIGGVILGALLRRVFGVPGALAAGGGSGVLAGTMLQSMALGGLAGVLVFVFTLGAGSRGARVLGGRRSGRDGFSGPVIVPGGGWSGGGSWGGGGGWSSGGGGDFSGGGASGDW